MSVERTLEQGSCQRDKQINVIHHCSTNVYHIDIGGLREFKEHAGCQVKNRVTAKNEKEQKEKKIKLSMAIVFV